MLPQLKAGFIELVGTGTSDRLQLFWEPLAADTAGVHNMPAEAAKLQRVGFGLCM